MSMNATVRWVEGMQTIGEAGSGHSLVMDTAPEGGGRDTGMRPLELLLLGLGGCTALDVVYIMGKMRKQLTGLEVSVEGDRRDEHPKIFETIRVVFRLRGRGLQEKDVAKAIRLSETQYCSASAMLARAATIETRFEIFDEDSGEQIAAGSLDHGA